jgi:hypothetical protein
MTRNEVKTGVLRDRVGGQNAGGKRAKSGKKTNKTLMF